MTQNTKRTLTVSHFIASGAAFAVDIETGESVHIRPQVVSAQGMTEGDIGDTFEGWVTTVPNKSALNLSAFIRWSDDDDTDQVQKLRQQLTDTRRELIAAQGKLEMIRDALERGPVKLAV